MTFELTSLVMEWLNTNRPGEFEYVQPRHAAQIYQIIRRLGIESKTMEAHPSSLFVTTHTIYLYKDYTDFTIIHAADPEFFDKIAAHLRDYHNVGIGNAH